MRDLLDDDIFHEQQPNPPPAVPHLVQQTDSMMFNTKNCGRKPAPLRLSLSDSKYLWDAYQCNVGPLVKIFHEPWLEALYQGCATGVEHPSIREMAILSAVNFAAIVSLSAEACLTKFGQNKTRLAREYQCSAEQAFREAGLLNTSSISVLQAFALFLTSMRRCDDSWLVLSWTGIAIRIAMSIGIHRDGSSLGLDAFETEMRRRLWYHLVLLDADLSEAHGVDYLIHQGSYSTQLPRNLNDADIIPGLSTVPEARIEFTAMTPSLVRLEIALRSRQLLQEPSGSKSLADGQTAMSSSESKIQIIKELETLLEERFLCHCSAAVPIQSVTSVVAQVKCSMLYFGVYHHLIRHQRSQSDAQAIRDTLFGIATDVVDRVRDIESHSRTSYWGWYLRGDIQWPAIVYLLNEVIVRPPGPSVDHAWEVIKRARRQYIAGRLLEAQGTYGARGMLFRPMRELTAKALMVKNAGSREEFFNSYTEPLTEVEQCGSTNDNSPALAETYDSSTGDLRAAFQTADDNSIWPPGCLSSFPDFWACSCSDGATQTRGDVELSAPADRRTFEEILLHGS